MLTENDKAYIAGLFDGEGSVYFDVLAGKFSGNHMPDSHKKRYLNEARNAVSNGWDAALAVTSNGWTTGLSKDGTYQAKQT